LQVMARSAEGVLLETGRLVLRQFTMSDVDNLAALDADPDVMRFITGGLATSLDEITDSLLPGFMAWYRRPGGYGCWAAEEKPTGAFLGWFRFHPPLTPVHWLSGCSVGYVGAPGWDR
jgi:RimJ/RimL family protein N-acetyltransferase